MSARPMGDGPDRGQFEADWLQACAVVEQAKAEDVETLADWLGQGDSYNVTDYTGQTWIEEGANDLASRITASDWLVQRDAAQRAEGARQAEAEREAARIQLAALTGAVERLAKIASEPRWSMLRGGDVAEMFARDLRRAIDRARQAADNA